MEHRAVLIAIEIGQVDCRRRKARVRRRSHRVEDDIVLVLRCEDLCVTIAQMLYFSIPELFEIRPRA
jgi:hypothetical protein